MGGMMDLMNRLNGILFGSSRWLIGGFSDKSDFQTFELVRFIL
jgi:hypothetical protein